MKTSFSLTYISIAFGALVSCSPTTPKPQTTAPTPKVAEVPDDVSLAKIPVLRSAWLEENWGDPRVSLKDDGGYRLTYRQGKTLNYVDVYGLMSAEPAPAKPKEWSEFTFVGDNPTNIYHKQSWKNVSIVGKSVKWYKNDSGGGADFPCYKTVDFSLTARDGRKGFYRVEVCTTSDEKAAELMRKVSW